MQSKAESADADNHLPAALLVPAALVVTQRTNGTSTGCRRASSLHSAAAAGTLLNWLTHKPASATPAPLMAPQGARNMGPCLPLTLLTRGQVPHSHTCRPAE
jgi:hypothetical protein